MELFICFDKKKIFQASDSLQLIVKNYLQLNTMELFNLF